MFEKVKSDVLKKVQYLPSLHALAPPTVSSTRYGSSTSQCARTHCKRQLIHGSPKRTDVVHNLNEVWKLEHIEVIALDLRRCVAWWLSSGSRIQAYKVISYRVEEVPHGVNYFAKVVGFVKEHRLAMHADEIRL